VSPEERRNALVVGDGDGLRDRIRSDHREKEVGVKTGGICGSNGRNGEMERWKDRANDLGRSKVDRASEPSRPESVSPPSRSP
jgi:hypothetical protein